MSRRLHFPRLSRPCPIWHPRLLVLLPHCFRLSLSLALHSRREHASRTVLMRAACSTRLCVFRRPAWHPSARRGSKNGARLVYAHGPTDLQSSNSRRFARACVHPLLLVFTIRTICAAPPVEHADFRFGALRTAAAFHACGFSSAVSAPFRNNTYWTATHLLPAACGD